MDMDCLTFANRIRAIESNLAIWEPDERIIIQWFINYLWTQTAIPEIYGFFLDKLEEGPSKDNNIIDGLTMAKYLVELELQK